MTTLWRTFQISNDWEGGIHWDQILLPQETMLEKVERLIYDYLKLFWIGHEANPATTRGPNVHQTKMRPVQEHTSYNAPYLTQARPLSSDTIHVAYNDLLMRRHISRRQLFSQRLYKGDMASPQRYDSFSHTFLHIPLISHIDLRVRVLTCLEAPFVPPWDCISTAPEHFAATVATIRSHLTDQRSNLLMVRLWKCTKSFTK